MTADASDSLALRRVKRNNYFACAAFFLVGLGFFYLLEPVPAPLLVGAQLVCCASFAGLGMGLGHGGLTEHTASLCSVVIGVVSATLLVHASGGPASPYFQVFGSLPCLIAMFTPDTRLPTVLGGAMTLVAVALLDRLAGVPTRTMVLQLTGFGLFSALSLFGTRTYRRLADARREAQEARLRALEQLAQSEHRRRLAECERAQVERLVLVGQLASGVAHEVNNPLSYVKSNLSFLERELHGPERPMDRQELREVLAETRQGVLRIQQIVADLRSFARASDGSEEQQGRLAEALNEATRMAAMRLRERGEVRLDLPPQLPEVRLGQRHMVQVLLNLLLNAADAVEMADPTREARISVGVRPVEGGVRLEVEDNGPGISEDVLPRLFEPFFTTKPPGKGTGLGLALCREYVSRAGGTLHAENRSEGGARFVLVLPAVSMSPVARA